MERRRPRASIESISQQIIQNVDIATRRYISLFRYINIYHNNKHYWHIISVLVRRSVISICYGYFFAHISVMVDSGVEYAFCINLENSQCLNCRRGGGGGLGVEPPSCSLNPPNKMPWDTLRGSVSTPRRTF
jgi:hypothetical protein